ncbi:hypothetical protein [Streptomyces sp. NPDC058955]|uniref:hypothetical protein n=1 Tax=unclassified Streptomyces TaxID=2593676 RepID=UPI003657528A
MTDTTTSLPLITGPVLQHIEAVLRRDLAETQARQEEIDRLEKAGHGIVSGGQIGWQPDVQATWNITDWRTGEVIAVGVGGYESYTAAGQRLDPDGKWIHIDSVEAGNSLDVDHGDIPESLASALLDWLGGVYTSHEDVAVVVGWSAEEVARHRRGSLSSSTSTGEGWRPRPWQLIETATPTGSASRIHR